MYRRIFTPSLTCAPSLNVYPAGKNFIIKHFLRHLLLLSNACSIRSVSFDYKLTHTLLASRRI